jgi:hypothetical protein
MAVIDLSASVVDGAIVAAAMPALVAGQAVKCPRRTRIVEFSAAVVVRVAMSNLDTTTLTDANSNAYAANETHALVVPGCSVGGRGMSTLADTTAGIVITFAGASADNVSLSFRS